MLITENENKWLTAWEKNTGVRWYGRIVGEAHDLYILTAVRKNNENMDNKTVCLHKNELCKCEIDGKLFIPNQSPEYGEEE